MLLHRVAFIVKRSQEKQLIVTEGNTYSNHLSNMHQQNKTIVTFGKCLTDINTAGSKGARRDRGNNVRQLFSV